MTRRAFWYHIRSVVPGKIVSGSLIPIGKDIVEVLALVRRRKPDCKTLGQDSRTGICNQMEVLCVHQNFPDQYLHLPRYLGTPSEDEVIFITLQQDVELPGVRKIV